MKLKERIAIVTGGSQGFGKAMAEELAKEGAHVIVVNRTAEKGIETAREINSKGGKASAIACDVSKMGDVENLVDRVKGEFQRIDILINNAGVWAGGALDTNSYDDIAKVLMVNTLGVIYATRAVLPLMKKQGFGKIINIGSTNGIETKPDRSVYIASKWAITGFTGALRKELEQFNISVMGINPGLMSTNLHKNGGVERDYTCAMDPVEVSKVIQFAVDMKDIVIENITFRNLHCELN